MGGYFMGKGKEGDKNPMGFLIHAPPPQKKKKKKKKNNLDLIFVGIIFIPIVLTPLSIHIRTSKIF
jgi:hypothetical protein